MRIVVLSGYQVDIHGFKYSCITFFLYLATNILEEEVA
jgi:hypothetical protein